MLDETAAPAIISIALMARAVRAKSRPIPLISALTNYNFTRASLDVATTLVVQSMAPGASQSVHLGPLLCALDFAWMELASSENDPTLLEPGALVAHARALAPRYNPRDLYAPELLTEIQSLARHHSLVHSAQSSITDQPAQA
ncbi:hypothetical protein [Amorphus sp. 3PC139-8]|uniref:hypothetical protein n=1 Tax=Amorphus sp. 3PC139-8 TaxID=2735676 RepID=UPI00345D0334